MPSYIERRRRRWYAKLTVPKDVREDLNTMRFVQSLETESQAIAERRATPLIATWKLKIEQARAAKGSPESQLDFEARSWREALLDAKDDGEREIILDLLRTKVDDIITKSAPAGETGRPDETLWEDLAGHEEAERFHGLATGAIVPTKGAAKEYITELRSTLEPKTADLRASTLETFAKEFPTMDLVTRKAVQRWATALTKPPHGRNGEGLKVATIRRMLSDCREFWRHLQLQELVSDDLQPFDRLVLATPRKTSKNGNGGDGRLPLPHKHLSFGRMPRFSDWKGFIGVSGKWSSG